MATTLSRARVLVVGLGGLGCPAARVLVQSGIGRIELVDDDLVDESNLHRQTLYRLEDCGKAKVRVAATALSAEAVRGGHTCQIATRHERVLPDSASDLVAGHDVVVEGADNFATKFLVADACALAGVPLISAGAVRWVGWAMASLPGGGACLRCIFEDLPREHEETCAAAGVVGPVVGVLGALSAALALRLLHGDPSAAGTLFGYDGLRGTLRGRAHRRRTDCDLCSGRITDTALARYLNAPPSDLHSSV
jgi:molybdopterin-synthase adenylyltransferase